MKAMRQEWFREWFIGKSMTPENILDFHKHGGLGFPEVDVFMRREKVGTVSITQVIRNQKKCRNELLCLLIRSKKARKEIIKPPNKAKNKKEKFNIIYLKKVLNRPWP